MNRSRRKTEAVATEGYQGSVSDLMAGLVILFIIALAVFLLQILKLREDFAENVRVTLETREQLLNDIREELEQRDVLEVEVIPDQGVLRLTQKHINFPQSRIEPDFDSHQTIGSLADVMAEVLPKYVYQVRDRQDDEEPIGEPGEFLLDSDDCSREPGTPDANPGNAERPQARLQTVLIEGHTDIIPVDVNASITPEFRFRNNLELSGMRATRVYQLMTDCKPQLESLWNTEEPIFGVSGYGATRLVSDDASLENINDPLHALNRRIDIRFLMEVPEFDGLGGFLGSGLIAGEVGAALEGR